jgi:hypothetical protein
MSLDLQIAIGIGIFVAGLFAGTIRGWNACGARVLDAARGEGEMTIDGVKLYVFREVDCMVVEREEDLDQLAAE